MGRKSVRMYRLITTPQFKKDFKKVKNNPSLYSATMAVLNILKDKGVKGVPKSMRPHRLKGRYKDNWECHIKPDLLIIWIQIDEEGIIRLVRLGSHSNLF